MTNLSIKLIVVLAVFGLSSCASERDYSATTPEFRLEQYFEGKVNAYGVVRNRSGQITRRFKVDITGHWSNNTLTLDEYFLFDDGEKDFRQWRITPSTNHSYIGRADDIIGEATGEASGAYLRWDYQLNLKVEDKTYKVRFDDEMMLLDDQRMMNIAKIKKFGITLGSVVIFFEKQAG